MRRATGLDYQDPVTGVIKESPRSSRSRIEATLAKPITPL
jgi:hypothetical protein